jgi:23S rRNA (uracil1939-C5)-methyltransferase
VVAVELSGAALPLLRENVAGLPVEVQGGDALATARALAAAGRRFEVALLDPPREGCPGLAEPLVRLGVERLVHVSCDPMTLARDLRELQGQGFRLIRVAGLDLMPQTFHLEAVALLER